MLKIDKVLAKAIFINLAVLTNLNLAVPTTIPNIALIPSKNVKILTFELSFSSILRIFQSNIPKINF